MIVGELSLAIKLLLGSIAALGVIEIGPELSRQLNTILNMLTIVLVAHYGQKNLSNAQRAADNASTLLHRVGTRPGGKRAVDPPPGGDSK